VFGVVVYIYLKTRDAISYVLGQFTQFTPYLWVITMGSRTPGWEVRADLGAIRGGGLERIFWKCELVWEIREINIFGKSIHS
jgi:hypothetical protein